MSKFDKLKKLMDPKAAEEILAAIDTPEKALALAGKDREQYLNALEALHGPQAKRAADMGFGPETWYHGTSENFQKFDKSKSLEDKNNIYITPNKETANWYTSAINHPQYADDAGQNIMPLKVKNQITSPKEDLLPEATVKNPADIRSKHAAFDPRFADSPYLMSAVGGAPEVSKTLSPFGQLRKAYSMYDEAVNKPISEGADKVAEKIVEATTIPGMPEETKKSYQDSAKGVLSTGLEMAGDPLNYLSLPIAGVSRASKMLKTIKGGENAAELMKLSKAPKGLDKVKQVSDEYMKARGLKIPDMDKLAEVNPELSKKIAQAYQELKHDPNDPSVKRAYEALVKETMDQYEAIKKSGLKIKRIEPGQENPYKNSQDLLKDISENNQMWYYPTSSGFGTGEAAGHPLLQPTKELYNGEPMMANDIFRIVHDYFGHGKKGVGFGPIGEENAWRTHRQMFTPEAAKALTTETRGQNSWVNFGPKGEANRANPANTTYAEQKAGLLPDWVHELDESGAKISNPEIARIAEGAKISNDVESPFFKLTSTPPAQSAAQKLRSDEDIVVSDAVKQSNSFKELMKRFKRE